MKRNVIILLFVLVLVPAHSAMARTCFLEIKYSFNNQSVAGKKVRGFKLFKNGAQICQVWKSTKRSFTCKFQSNSGKYKFTLAPFFTDKSIGAHSAPATLYIPKKSTNTWVTGTTSGGSSTNTSGTTSGTNTTRGNTNSRLSPSKVRIMTGVMGIVNQLLLEEDRR
jgi:hypothetical protein